MRDEQKTLDFCARLAICMCRLDGRTGCNLSRGEGIAAPSSPSRRGNRADMGRSLLRPYTKPKERYRRRSRRDYGIHWVAMGVSGPRLPPLRPELGSDQGRQFSLSKNWTRICLAFGRGAVLSDSMMASC